LSNHKKSQQMSPTVSSIVKEKKFYYRIKVLYTKWCNIFIDVRILLLFSRLILLLNLVSMKVLLKHLLIIHWDVGLENRFNTTYIIRSITCDVSTFFLLFSSLFCFFSSLLVLNVFFYNRLDNWNQFNVKWHLTVQTPSRVF
jgi:hypothetical protein